MSSLPFFFLFTQERGKGGKLESEGVTCRTRRDRTGKEECISEGSGQQDQDRIQEGG